MFAQEPMSRIEEESEIPKDNRCRAIIAINLFSVSIVFTSVIWKHLAEEGVNVIDFNFFRNFTIFCLATIALIIGNHHPIREFPSDQKYRLLLLVLCGLGAVILFYAAVAIAPLTIVNTIIKLDSFIVLILGYLINREALIPVEVIGMFICFSAIAAMTFSAKKTTDAATGEEVEEDSNLRMVGILIALIVACFGGTMPILTRTLKDVPATLMMFYLGLVGSLLIGIYLLVETLRSEGGFSELRLISYTGKQFLLILVSTIFSAIATTSYTIAYQSDSSGFIVLIGNVKILYFFLSDTFIFHEVFSTIEMTCVCVITVVIVIVALIKIMDKKETIEK